MKRYALLDTDFISKTHSVQDDNGNHLIDRVMELPEYEFFCHAQIVTELNRYNADAPIWLSEKIGAQKIKSYTDQEILESLSLVRGPLACATYTQMLKLACDAFSKDYFSEHYRVLEEADYTVISREDYLKELERLDIEVGKKNNLGEIKSFVLLQVLSVMLGEQIYISIKVRSQLDIKRRKGEFIGGYAVYGYSKDEQNKNRLVVDEYAADIVRSIYRRKLEGMSANSIADQLNSEGVLAPSEYKRLCGLNYHSGFKTGTHAKWQAIQVLRILKNEVYTGTMVQGKRQKINYKDAITLVSVI